MTSLGDKKDQAGSEDVDMPDKPVGKQDNTLQTVKKNINRLLEMKDMKTLDEACWNYEMKAYKENKNKDLSWGTTGIVQGKTFKDASKDDIEFVASCQGTTVGVMKEFLCPGMQWTSYVPNLSKKASAVERIAPTVLHVAFIDDVHDRDPIAHELIIVEGRYVFQSRAEYHRIKKSSCNWDIVFPCLDDAEDLGRVIVPGVDPKDWELHKVALYVPKF